MIILGAISQASFGPLQLLTSLCHEVSGRGSEKRGASFFFFSFFFFKVYLFLGQRETAWMGEGQRERETQNRKQAPGSEPSAQSPTWGSNSRTARSWPGEVWRLTDCATQAPREVLLSNAPWPSSSRTIQSVRGQVLIGPSLSFSKRGPQTARAPHLQNRWVFHLELRIWGYSTEPQGVWTRLICNTNEWALPTKG